MLNHGHGAGQHQKMTGSYRNGTAIRHENGPVIEVRFPTATCVYECTICYRSYLDVACVFVQLVLASNHVMTWLHKPFELPYAPVSTALISQSICNDHDVDLVPTMTLQVTLVTTPEEMAISKRIRLQVFVQEQGFAEEHHFDEYDEHPLTRHFLGKDIEQNKYVATTRIVVTPAERKGRIGRVAVMKECRGKNYGMALMLGAEEQLAHEADAFVVLSRYDTVGFYAKCGYERVDDVMHTVESVDHCMMAKKAKA